MESIFYNDPAGGGIGQPHIDALVKASCTQKSLVNEPRIVGTAQEQKVLAFFINAVQLLKQDGNDLAGGFVDFICSLGKNRLHLVKVDH